MECSAKNYFCQNIISPTFHEDAIGSIPFPCQLRQNEIELCHDGNQDRGNEFQFRFREKIFSRI